MEASAYVACPKCATRVALLPGWHPVCGSCGYTTGNPETPTPTAQSSTPPDYSPQALAKKLDAGETVKVPPESLLGLQIRRKNRQQNEDRRPGFSILATILYILGAIAIVGVLVVLQGLVEVARATSGDASAQQLAQSLSFTQFLLFAVIILYAVIAYGLLRRRTWSRVLSMLVSASGVAVSFWNIVNFKTGPEWILLSYWTSLALAIGLFYGMDRPHMRRYYNSKKLTSVFER